MNNELTSLSSFAFDINLSAVRFDGLFDKAQTQTVAVNLFVNDFFRTVKRLENFAELAFLDADSLIFD